MQNFTLDQRLESDCFEIFDFTLSKLLLMNESRYPWFILVPRINELKELVDLNLVQRQRFLEESDLVSRFLQSHFKAEKLNIAALGNVVSQLHIHHIARFATDDAWPAPVWGKLPTKPYDEAAVTGIKNAFEDYMKKQEF